MNESKHIYRCPACENRRHYVLSDGRLKCAICRHVYTANSRSSRLSDEQLAVLAERFWAQTSSMETSDLLSLNIKTVQRHFQIIRQEIARVAEQECLINLGTKSVFEHRFQSYSHRTACGQQATPIVALISDTLHIHVLPVHTTHATNTHAPACISGWLYGRNKESAAKCLLDQIHLTTAEAHDADILLPFWQLTKRSLSRYQGGFRHNFTLYLQEMAFRYNLRNTANPAATCKTLLIQSLSHKTGDTAECHV